MIIIIGSSVAPYPIAYGAFCGDFDQTAFFNSSLHSQKRMTSSSLGIDTG